MCENEQKSEPIADKDQVHQLISEITKLKYEIRKQREHNKSIRHSIRRKYNLVEEIEKEIKIIDEEKGIPKEELLRSVFSEAQINILKGNQKKIFWTDDDLAQAFSLRHMGGKDLYLYLKNTLNYPLPSLSCVQAWAANK